MIDKTIVKRSSISISRTKSPVIHGGRRNTLTNRDLLASNATNGGMLAIVTSATQGMGPPSGWHYHPCNYQFIVIERGWIDIQIEDGTDTRLEEGDTILLPGYVRHNVVATADDISVMTITVPSTYDVIMSEPPPQFSEA